MTQSDWLLINMSTNVLVAKEKRYVAGFAIIIRNIVISKHKRKHFRKGIRKIKKRKDKIR